ncbi:hypothetical protein H5410_001280 [Solanum commersonii]|uniref:Uncharacterized protein n=1 Tax=Solanum commersonii TaxID=4109 RepID=A0A9J6AZ80_SOLCO|nr:hypothetical protein H5410_001280 [Solanum commersonii]
MKLRKKNTILKSNGLEDFFRNSCLGQYLYLPEKNNARFQMTMNNEKKDEVLINYRGMPLFFDKREFAIVTGLNKGEAQTSKEQSIEEQDLVSFVGPSFQNPQLIYLLNDKDTPKKHQVTIAEEEISSPRILRWLREKNVYHAPNLFNPPYDVVNDPSVAICDTKHKCCYRCPYFATYHPYVVHPWLVPTEKELQMSSMITLGLVETLFDPVVNNVKRELLGATTIKRARLDD